MERKLKKFWRTNSRQELKWRIAKFVISRRSFDKSNYWTTIDNCSSVSITGCSSGKMWLKNYSASLPRREGNITRKWWTWLISLFPCYKPHVSKYLRTGTSCAWCSCWRTRQFLRVQYWGTIMCEYLLTSNQCLNVKIILIDAWYVSRNSSGNSQTRTCGRCHLCSNRYWAYSGTWI
jgi:hypothetical protein